MIKLTKQTILDLCDLAVWVEVDDKHAQLEIVLGGRAAQVVRRWSNENLRRDEAEMRRDLARWKRMADEGDPVAIGLMAARRDARAVPSKMLTPEQVADTLAVPTVAISGIPAEFPAD